MKYNDLSDSHQATSPIVSIRGSKNVSTKRCGVHVVL